MFNVYESYKEFVDKNLIKLTNIKEYVTYQGKEEWNSIMLNINIRIILLNQIQTALNGYVMLCYEDCVYKWSCINIWFVKVCVIHQRNNTLKNFILYINK